MKYDEDGIDGPTTRALAAELDAYKAGYERATERAVRALMAAYGLERDDALAIVEGR